MSDKTSGLCKDGRVEVMGKWERIWEHGWREVDNNYEIVVGILMPKNHLSLTL